MGGLGKNFSPESFFPNQEEGSPKMDPPNLQQILLGLFRYPEDDSVGAHPLIQKAPGGARPPQPEPEPELNSSHRLTSQECQKNSVVALGHSSHSGPLRTLRREGP